MTEGETSPDAVAVPKRIVEHIHKHYIVEEDPANPIPTMIACAFVIAACAVIIYIERQQTK